MAPRRGGRPGILGNYFWSISPQSQFNFVVLSNKKTEIHPVHFNMCRHFGKAIVFMVFTVVCFFQHHFVFSAIGARSAGGALLPLEGKDRLGRAWNHPRHSVGRESRHPGKHGVKIGVKGSWAGPLGPLLEWGRRGGRGLVLLFRAREAARLVVGGPRRARTVL